MPYLAYKFRIYPNSNQTRELESQLETLRQVYNAALAYRRDLYAAEKRLPKPGELYKVLAGLRNLQLADQKTGGTGPHWLTRVAAMTMRGVLDRVDRAFKLFFGRIREKAAKSGYPRFKGRRRGIRSIPFESYGPNQGGCKLKTKAGHTVAGDMPADANRGHFFELFGVGRIKIEVHRPISGTIKTVAVTRDVDGKWYAVFVAKQVEQAVEPRVGPAVGVDVGLEHFLTTSDGEHVPNPRHLKANLKKLRRLQRAASRKVLVAKKAKRKFRECRNLQKSFGTVARLHVRVRNLRKESHHQIANSLVRRYATVCVESLNVANMVRNGKLSRAISDAGWSGFRAILKHKAERAGVGVVEVDARGTSQTCPECGGEVRKTLNERTHRCPHCGYTAQRDHAAARVILARGTGSHGSGSDPARHNSGVAPGAGRSSHRNRTDGSPDSE